ncbi:hypothetical protein, partial [Halobacterium sp. KA-6]|uniref:hypothetical protein n=1 Tax=Halobacterium sp. KA-6 TaxID=2896368 RepID=UPI001E659775
ESSGGIPLPVSKKTAFAGVGVALVLVILYVYLRDDSEDSAQEVAEPDEEDPEEIAEVDVSGGLTSA